jgi:hypothetical protein
MPKTTPESDYIKFMSSLQSKIRAEEVGLQSWKGGKRVQIAPIKMNVTDTLQAGDKLVKAQQLQNKMVEEYLEKQKVPIKRYNEYGDVIGEYKYHEIPPPELENVELDIPAKIETLMDNDGMVIERELVPARNIVIPIENIEEVKERETTRFNNNIITINREIEDHRRIIYENEAELLDTNNEIVKARERRATVLDEIQTQYDQQTEQIDKGPKKGRSKAQKKLIATTANERRIFLAENDRIIGELQAYASFNRRQIDQSKQELDELQKMKQLTEEEFNIVNAEIDKVSTNNKKKIKAYQQELQRMNTGPLGLNRNVDETDIEYAQRLYAIANEEIPTERTKEKAFQLNKEELRDNFRTIIRDNSVIEQVVNSLAQDHPEDIFGLNKTFPLFKSKFIKRFGEFNKNLEAQDILKFIGLIQLSLDNEFEQQLVLFQSRPRREEEPEFGVPSSSFSSSYPAYPSESSSFNPYASSSSVPLSESTRNILGTDYSAAGPSASEYEEDPETGLIPPSSLKEATILSSTPATILPIPKDQNRVLYYKNPYLENAQAFLKLALIKKGGKSEPVVFISPDGTEGSYRSTIFTDSNEHGIHQLLQSYLGSDDYYGKYKINLDTGEVIEPKEKALKEDILNVFRVGKIQPSDPRELKKINKDGRDILVGLGLKMSDDVQSIPTIINFGLVFLLLRKLYLHNILSIQNNHYKKVNGFNNVKVSDTFVEIIQDILNNKNYVSKLAHLSSNEREIFDHLLYVAGLHKKLNGGSIADTNKLKKELEMLEGEIISGNNNKALQKQLFKLLQKMAHYKMISSHIAQKHYKQFDPYFK